MIIGSEVIEQQTSFHENMTSYGLEKEIIRLFQKFCPFLCIYFKL